MKQLPSLGTDFYPRFICAFNSVGGTRGAAQRWVADTSCGLRRQGKSFRESFEVQDPADQMDFLLDAEQSASAEAPEAVPVLGLSEELFDEFAAPLRQAVPHAALPHPDPGMRRRAPARLGGNVWLDGVGEQRSDEIGVEEPLVGPERRRGKAQPPLGPRQQRQASPLLGRRSLEYLDAQPEQEAMTILHHRVYRKPRIRAGARAPLGHEATIRIGGRAMGGIAPLLSAEIHRAVARVRRPIRLVPILRPQ